MNSKVIYLKKTPEGIPDEKDFEIREEKLDIALQDGQLLVKSLYFSVDPYLRGRMSGQTTYPLFKAGSPMFSPAVGQVLESKRSDIRKGDIIKGELMWSEKSKTEKDAKFHVIDTKEEKWIRAYLGVLGMPGLTAYFGLLDIGRPKDGDTIVVSGAAGAVGSVVGQIAKLKLKDVRVIGIAGGPEKAKKVLELGFDGSIDYKHVGNLQEALKKHCPKGIDIYFDNVGGEILDCIVPLMNIHGRIVQCGSISTYNLKEIPRCPRMESFIIYKRLRIEGFLFSDYEAYFPKANVELKNWLKESKLKYDETVYQGIDKLPVAFKQLFLGGNIGKMLAKVGDVDLSILPQEVKST